MWGQQAVCFCRRIEIARYRPWQQRAPLSSHRQLTGCCPLCPCPACAAVFTNRVEAMRLQDLAEMDVREMVQQVQEYFGDFIALEPHHFLVPLPRTHLAMQPFAWDFGNSSDAVARMTEGVASLVLSLRRRFLIRCVRWVAAAAAAAAGGVRLAVLV